jgi:hypothetical protein
MTEIDYNIQTLDGRIQVVNKIIEENYDAIMRYMKHVLLDEDESGKKTKRQKIPFNPLLHKLTNYLYYFDNQLTRKQKGQRKFEKSTVNLYDKKKEGVQIKEDFELKRDIKFSLEDIEDIAELKEINNFIIDLKRSSNADLKSKKFKWIKDLRDNQLEIKESKKPSIKQFYKCSIPSTSDTYEIDESCYVLDILDINNPFNLDLFEPENWKTVLKVLPFKKQISSNIDKLINIFNKCYGRCIENLNPIQRSIIQIYQKGIDDPNSFDFKVVKNCDISNILNIDNSSTRHIIESICKKLYKTYNDLFTDYYYTFLAKGTYKTCSKCGKQKLIQDFKNNPDAFDGKHSICKECLNENYKICSKCGQKLNKNLFGDHPKTKDGKQSWCVECNKKYNSEKRKNIFNDKTLKP